MDQGVSAAIIAEAIPDDYDGGEGFIEDLDDLLRVAPHDLQQLPPVPQAFTRRQRELGGGHIPAFDRCKDRLCNACRAPDCGELEATRGLNQFCTLCHYSSPQFCLLRLPCEHWQFDLLHQFREAQEAQLEVRVAQGLQASRQEEHDKGPGEELVDQERPGQEEQMEQDDLAEEATGATRELSGVTPRLFPSPSRVYQSSPRPEEREDQGPTPLRRTGQQSDLSQTGYQRERLSRTEGLAKPFPLSTFWKERGGGAWKMEDKFGPGPIMSSTPHTKKDVRFEEPHQERDDTTGKRQERVVEQTLGQPGLNARDSWQGPKPDQPRTNPFVARTGPFQKQQSTNPFETWMGPDFGQQRLNQQHANPFETWMGPDYGQQRFNQQRANPFATWMGPDYGQQRLNQQSTNPFETGMGPDSGLQRPRHSTRLHHSDQETSWPPHSTTFGAQIEGGRRGEETDQSQEPNIARNQEKIVDVLQMVADKLSGGAGESRNPATLRLPNLVLPSPKKSSSGRVDTKEFHLWRVALEKTVRNNNLSPDAVLSLYASNTKLTTEDWVATFQASPDLNTALRKLDEMHAPIQHLYGQLIRQITETPTMHGYSTRERIYQLNLLIQYLDEFLTFFGATSDLNREQTMIVLAKIAESKDARDISFRTIYSFDLAYQEGFPYSRSLKKHLIDVRLLAVDLEAALEAISSFEGKPDALRTAAVKAEEKGKPSPPPAVGGKKEGPRRPQRPPPPRPTTCLLCLKLHPTYHCSQLKTVKAGATKLSKECCPRCLSKIEPNKPHSQECGIKRMMIDDAFVLLKFTCDHDVHHKICTHKNCVDAKTKKTLDPDQSKRMPKVESFATQVITLASNSCGEEQPGQVAFMKELTALKGRDGTTLSCLVYYDTMGSKSFLKCKEGFLPPNFEWNPSPAVQTFAITTVTGQEVMEKKVHEVRLVTVKGLVPVVAVEGGLEGDISGKGMDPVEAHKHRVDAPTEGEMNAPSIILILGSDMSHLMPRVQEPPRSLKKKYPQIMLAHSVLSNRTLYFGPLGQSRAHQGGPVPTNQRA